MLLSPEGLPGVCIPPSRYAWKKRGGARIPAHQPRVLHQGGQRHSTLRGRRVSYVHTNGGGPHRKIPHTGRKAGRGQSVTALPSPRQLSGTTGKCANRTCSPMTLSTQQHWLRMPVPVWHFARHCASRSRIARLLGSRRRSCLLVLDRPPKHGGCPGNELGGAPAVPAHPPSGRRSIEGRPKSGPYTFRTGLLAYPPSTASDQGPSGRGLSACRHRHGPPSAARQHCGSSMLSWTRCSEAVERRCPHRSHPHHAHARVLQGQADLTPQRGVGHDHV